AEEVTWCMALSAVAEGLHEIASPILDRVQPGVACERPGREEQHFPDADQRTPTVWKTKVVRLAGTIAGRQRSKVGPQIPHVLIRHSRERGIRKRGKVVRSVRPLALAHGANEVAFGPAADAVFRMRRDVGPVERAERCLEWASAGESHGVVH